MLSSILAIGHIKLVLIIILKIDVNVDVNSNININVNVNVKIDINPLDLVLAWMLISSQTSERVTKDGWCLCSSAWTVPSNPTPTSAPSLLTPPLVVSSQAPWSLVCKLELSTFPELDATVVKVKAPKLIDLFNSLAYYVVQQSGSGSAIKD